MNSFINIASLYWIMMNIVRLFPLGIAAYLFEEISFVVVALACVPTEDGWERANNYSS